MSLKSRLQSKRRSKSTLPEFTDVDLIDFLENNRDINKLVIYSYNEIYTEKNGEEIPSDIKFSSEAAYKKAVYKIAELYENIPSSENPHTQINISDEINMEIIIPPLISEGIYTVFSRVNEDNGNYFKNSVSSEIYAYLQEGIKQKLNIFVIGSADISKANAMNFLLNLCDNKHKLIISDKRNEIRINRPYCLKINECGSNINNFVYDNIFANEVNTKELINIFELIISGCKGFVVSLSLKDKTDILEAIRNKILLTNPNLFEENADFMSGSSIDVILKLGCDINKNIIITKVSEIYNNTDKYTIKDIFTVNDDEQYVSVGNRSHFFNKTNSPEQFSESYFKKEHLHSKNIVEQTVLPVIERAANEIFEKEIIKEAEQTELTENITVTEEKPLPLNNFQNILTDTEKNFETEKIKENTEEIKKEEKPLSKLEKLKNKIKRNKKLKEINSKSPEQDLTAEQESFSENTDEKSDIEQIDTEKENPEKSDDNITKEEEVFQTLKTSTILPPANILENTDEDVEEDVGDNSIKYDDFYEDDEIVEEPELFSEIKDVEINDNEYDFDIQDENI